MAAAMEYIQVGTWAAQNPVTAVVAAVLLFLLFWAWKVNRAMKTTPPEVFRLTKGPWLAEDIRKVYRRVEETPPDWTPHLPPKLERRYIVVGGSGTVTSTLS